MFNVGGGELIVILLIALIVLGPQRLPSAARQMGKALSELRRVSTGFQNEVRTAFEEVDDQPPVAAPADRPVRTTPLKAAAEPTPPAATDRAQANPVTSRTTSAGTTKKPAGGRQAAVRKTGGTKAVAKKAPKASSKRASS